jgi:hypothetical protein
MLAFQQAFIIKAFKYFSIKAKVQKFHSKFIFTHNRAVDSVFSMVQNGVGQRRIVSAF